MSDYTPDTKLRVWVTSNEGQTFSTGSKTLVFNIKKKEFFKLMQFIDREHKIWTMTIVYLKSENTEIKRYYNFDKKRTFPENNNDF